MRQVEFSLQADPGSSFVEPVLHPLDSLQLIPRYRHPWRRDKYTLNPVLCRPSPVTKTIGEILSHPDIKCDRIYDVQSCRKLRQCVRA